jgi:hypothetical protein
MSPPYDFSPLNQTTKAVISDTDQYHFQKVANILHAANILNQEGLTMNNTLRNQLKGADFAFVSGKRQHLIL